MEFKSKDYFPATINSIYVYNGLGNNHLNFKKYISYADNDKFQIQFVSDEMKISNVYEYTKEGIKLNFSRSNINFIQNLLNIKNKFTDYIIREPIKQGNTWKLSDGSIRYISSVNSQVKTRLNLYSSALEITTLSKDCTISIDYYVANIGLVKSIYYSDNLKLLVCELEDILLESPLPQDIRIYYPDKNLNSIWYCKRNINFYSNDDINIIFSKEFESPPKGLIPLINRSSKINKMYYDIINDTAYIDLSNDFLNISAFDTEYSSILFSAIYETIKCYYNTLNVYITLSGIDYRQYFSKRNLPERNTSQEWLISDSKFPLTYVIKNNDSIMQISRKFNIPYNKLIKLNSLKNPNNLLSGDVLQIYSPDIYTVKVNDTIRSICEDYQINYNDILKINNLTSLDLLTPGQKIKLC